MSSSFAKTVANAVLEKTENEAAAMLIRLKKLLRVRNSLRSPLLRLPTEIILHILSYLMEDMRHSFVWRPILGTCYSIGTIM
jgi:hypothetical protein